MHTGRRDDRLGRRAGHGPPQHARPLPGTATSEGSRGDRACQRRAAVGREKISPLPPGEGTGVYVRLFHDFQPAERRRNVEIGFGRFGINPTHPGLDGRRTGELPAAIVDRLTLHYRLAAAVVAELGPIESAEDFYAGHGPRKSHLHKRRQRDSPFDHVAFVPRRGGRPQTLAFPFRIELAIVGRPVVERAAAGVDFETEIVLHLAVAAKDHFHAVLEDRVFLVAQLAEHENVGVLDAESKIEVLFVAKGAKVGRRGRGL